MRPFPRWVRFLIPMAVVLLMGLGIASALTQPQTREVDFTALLNERVDRFIALLTEEFGEAASQLVPFLEAGRAGLAAGQTQPLAQSLAVVASFLLTLTEAGRLAPLSAERVRAAAALVADAAVLAFPEEELTVSLGLYRSASPEETPPERVAGPFLGECPQAISLSLPTGEKRFELADCVSALPR